MRVSSAQMFNQNMQAFNGERGKQAALQSQISSGLKLQRPSDDPAAMAQAMDLEQTYQRTKQFDQNITLAEDRLKLEEATLSSTMDIMQRVRELTVQAGNTTMTDESRRAISVELTEQMEALASLANTIDANGDYLYGGFQGKTKPIEINQVGDVKFGHYAGDQGQRQIQVSESRQVKVGDSGFDVFFKVTSDEALKTVATSANAQVAPATVFDSNAATGDDYQINFTAPGTFDIVNTSTGSTVQAGVAYQAGDVIEFEGIRTAINGAPAAGDTVAITQGKHQDAFTMMHKLQAALDKGVSTQEDTDRLSASVSQGLEEIDSFMQNVIDTRTSVGGRLKALESQRSDNETYQLQTKTTLSNLRDTDYPEAISDLQFSLFVLEAAQKSFTSIENNSLFNYM